MPRDRSRPPSDPSRDDQRIAKLLARAGIASRREVERMIVEGRVALNGTPIDTPATLLTSLDGVTVDGNPVAAPAPARLFLYHKPTGLLVTERDPAGRPTIYDRLPRTLPRVVPVGRLDLNTEGLLLLTTDGGLKRQLELPATGVERSYRARAYGQVSQEQLEELIEGVEIEGIRYGKIDANLERRTGANVWIEMTLTEGKNREVRRVLEHLGLKVGRLIRTRYGPFVLGDLPPGEVGEVRAHDVASFRKNPTRLDLPQPARNPLRREPPPEPSAPAEPPRAARPAPRRPRPAGGRARPATERAPRPARAGEEAPRSGTTRPARKPRPPRTEEVAKPARAARARAFRDATGRETAAPAPAQKPRRSPDGSARSQRSPADAVPSRPGGKPSGPRPPRPGPAGGARPRRPRG